MCDQWKADKQGAYIFCKKKEEEKKKEKKVKGVWVGQKEEAK